MDRMKILETQETFYGISWSRSFGTVRTLMKDNFSEFTAYSFTITSSLQFNENRCLFMIAVS